MFVINVMSYLFNGLARYLMNLEINRNICKLSEQLNYIYIYIYIYIVRPTNSKN